MGLMAFAFLFAQSGASLASTEADTGTGSGTGTGTLSGNRLQDVQIGENGQTTRIALFCRSGCDVRQRSNGFVILGIDETTTIPLKRISSNADALTFRPMREGALLSIDTDRVVLRSSVKECTADQTRATCIDLEFSRQPYARNSSQSSDDENVVIASAGGSDEASGKADLATEQNQSSQNQSGQKLAQQASPISLAPPSQIDGPQRLALRNSDALEPLPGATSSQSFSLREDKPVLVNAPARSIPSANAPRTGGTSILRPVETAAVLTRIDFREMSEQILQRRIDAEQCAQAQSTLSQDAWALDAMATLGFCAGGDGEFEKAEGIFKQLSSQDPENADALIGRALIARVTQEPTIAAKYFADALAVSDDELLRTRIIQASAKTP